MAKCLEDGCLRFATGPKGRCADHSRRTWYQGGWEKFAREMIDQWVSVRGPLCVGWKREPHVVTRADLTLDHIEGRSSAAGFQVLCRSCNSSKGNADALARAQLRR